MQQNQCDYTQQNPWDYMQQNLNWTALGILQIDNIDPKFEKTLLTTYTNNYKSNLVKLG